MAGFAESAACTGKSSRFTTIRSGLYKTVPTCSATYNDDCFNNVQPWPDSTAYVRACATTTSGSSTTPRAPSSNGQPSARWTSTSFRRRLILTAGTRYYKFDESEAWRRRGQLLLQEFRADHLLRSLHLGDQRQRQAGRPPGQQPGQRPVRHKPECSRTSTTPQYHGFRSRANLSWHVTDDVLRVLHLVARIPAGRVQPRHQVHAARWSRHAYQYITPATYSPGHAHQQRARLQDRVAESSPASQRRRIPGRLEEHHRGILRSAAGLRQPDLRHQWPQLPGAGRRAAGGRARDRRADRAVLGFVQQKFPGQFALLDRQQSGQSRTFGKPVLGATVPIPNVFGLQGSPLGESPEIQANLRLRYEFPLGEYKAFSQVGGQYYGRSFSTVGTVDNYRWAGWATMRRVGRASPRTRGTCSSSRRISPTERQRLHELGPVHHDGDGAPSADRRRQVRLQVLGPAPGPAPARPAAGFPRLGLEFKAGERPAFRARGHAGQQRDPQPAPSPVEAEVRRIRSLLERDQFAPATRGSRSPAHPGPREP